MISSRLNKGKDYIVSRLLEELARSTSSFIENAISESTAKSMNKMYSRINQSQSKNGLVDFSLKFGPNTAAGYMKLAGFFGNADFGTIANTELTFSTAQSTELRASCSIQNFGDIPDPVPLQPQAFAGSIDSLVNAANSVDIGNRNVDAADKRTVNLVLPIKTIQYALWKRFGKDGICEFKPLKNQNSMILGFNYNGTPQIILEEISDQKNSGKYATIGALAIEFPEIRMRLPKDFAINLEGKIKTKFPNFDLGGILDEQFVLKNLKYRIKINETQSDKENTYHFGVFDSAMDVPTSRESVIDLASHVVERLTNDQKFNSANFEDRKSSIANIILELVLNHSLKKSLYDVDLAWKSNEAILEKIALGPEGVAIRLLERVSNPGTQVQSLSHRSSTLTQFKNQPFDFQSLSDKANEPTSFNTDQVHQFFLGSSIYNAVGQEFKVAMTDLEKYQNRKGLTCKQSTPTNLDTGTRINYITCSSQSKVIEYRLHSSQKYNDQRSQRTQDDFKIFFQTTKIHDKGNTISSSHEVSDWLGIHRRATEKFGPPRSDLQMKVYKMSYWSNDDVEFRIISTCTKDDGSCDLQDRLATEVSFWKFF